MSKTVSVAYGDRRFWAYDVSFRILLLEAVLLAEETPAHERPEGSGKILEGFRINALVGADFQFPLDNESWDDRQQQYAHTLIAGAGRRLRSRERITVAEVAQRYVVGGQPVFLRGVDHVDGPVIADLADAMAALILDELPPVPPPALAWFYGTPDGTRTL